MERRDVIKLLGSGIGAAAFTNAQGIALGSELSASASPDSGYQGNSANHSSSAPVPPEQASATPTPLLTPAPRHLVWNGTAMPLPDNCQLVASTAAEQQIAQILQEEMLLLHHSRTRIVAKAPAGQPHILLALTSTPSGAASLQKATDRELWQTTEDKSEAYLLEVNGDGAVVLADSPRGLLYGAQTLLQLIKGEEDSRPATQITGANIVDYPQLAVRGMHIVVFPTTDLETVRREILMASRYKYNTIIMEFWASLKSPKWPQTAYDHAYTHDQVRPLIKLGRALQMEMVPALNSAGHQAGMRAVSGENVVLDRYPELKGLFLPDGWSLCLSNPAIYPFLFDRYAELIELFDQPKFFHVGIDEAWNPHGKPLDPRCWPSEPHEMISAHLGKIYKYFSDRKIEILMWHDMFLDRSSHEHDGFVPANSIPPINSYLSLATVPKDVTIAAWNYGVSTEWPVPAYFHDKGYPVLVCVWKRPANTISLINTAKKLNLRGMLSTTWDSEAVVFPTIGQAGVLAWTAPGYDVKVIPFEHWLTTVRQLSSPSNRYPFVDV